MAVTPFVLLRSMRPPDRRQDCSKYTGFQELHFLEIFRNFQRTEQFGNICSNIFISL